MKKIFLAGHNGLVGKSLFKYLSEDKNNIIITKDKKELNLISQLDVEKFFIDNKFDEVYLAAAKVGGIYANNSYPANFIYENLMINTNIIHSAYLSNVPKLMFLGSSCIYPKLCKQPILESYLLTDTLEPTNEPYALSKISAIKMCESYNRQYNTDYRSVMLTNLYGENDSFDLNNSHVIPGLINKIHKAKSENQNELNVWGTGKPKRDFLYVDDAALGIIFVMNLEKKIYKNNTQEMLSHINIGSGSDISIKELVLIIKEIIGYQGNILFDTNQLDGTPRKLLNTDLINSLGWKPNIDLYNGILKTYEWYLKNVK